MSARGVLGCYPPPVPGPGWRPSLGHHHPADPPGVMRPVPLLAKLVAQGLLDRAGAEAALVAPFPPPSGTRARRVHYFRDLVAYWESARDRALRELRDGARDGLDDWAPMAALRDAAHATNARHRRPLPSWHVDAEVAAAVRWHLRHRRDRRANGRHARGRHV